MSPPDAPTVAGMRLLQRAVRALLTVSVPRFTVLFLLVAVLVSVLIVLSIDLLWDGRLNAELQFAGVVTPLLDALVLVVFIVAMLNEIREEVSRRQGAEVELRRLNEVLEERVAERTRQLLAAQDELLRKEKLALLGQVAGSVGHELRNPLGVMSNAVYYLEAVSPAGDATTREYLGIIKEQIAAAARIVADLLDSVRTTAPHRESVDVRGLVEKTLGQCRVPVGVDVSLDIPRTLPPVLVDPQQIGQVFRNLIANGIDAMGQGGALEIRASEEGSAKRVLVSVRDSGCGMTPEQLAKAFQPLFTSKARGIGLGLVVVKNLAEANGGRVEVHSEPGRGSTFAVSLPIGPSGGEAAAEQPIAPEKESES